MGKYRQTLLNLVHALYKNLYKIHNYKYIIYAQKYLLKDIFWQSIIQISRQKTLYSKLFHSHPFISFVCYFTLSSKTSWSKLRHHTYWWGAIKVGPMLDNFWFCYLSLNYLCGGILFHDHIGKKMINQWLNGVARVIYITNWM